PAGNPTRSGRRPDRPSRASPSRERSADGILDTMMTQPRYEHTWTLALAALLAALAVTFVPSASADAAPPNVAALHAFVGDPLFGLDTPQGMLFGKLPDDETQMGSTTKIWARG